MHGHGERPHLCFYPGCDRAMSGNGFPRRYNLYDHMKRVHDHREEVTSSNASPELPSGEFEAPKRATGRKRKVVSVPTRPPAQRQRTMTPSPIVPINSIRPMPSELSHPTRRPALHERKQSEIIQHRQHANTQWVNQRELLTRQMHSMQGPGDENSLQRLSQNVEELWRLREQARVMERDI